MRLSEGEVGKEYVIDEINTEEKVKRRMLVLGIIKSTKIIILNKKINGALIIKVRGTRIGVSKNVADTVTIMEEEKVKNARDKISIYRKS